MTERSTTSARMPRIEHGCVAMGDRLGLGLERREQQLASPRAAILTISPIAARSWRSGSDRRAATSRTIADGWWNAPTQVLALGQVDAGLAADRRVDLRDERGRDLDPWDTAEVGCCQEARRIAQRAAADRDQRLVSFDVTTGEVSCGSLDDRQVLRLLARRAASPSRPGQPAARSVSPRFAECRPGAGLAHDHGAARAQLAERRVDRLIAAIESPMTMSPIGVVARSSVVAGVWPIVEHLFHRAEHRRDVGYAVDRMCRGIEALARRRQGSDPAQRIVALDRAGARLDVRRSRCASTSGRTSSHTGTRPRYSAQRLRGSTTAPPPGEITRRRSGARVGLAEASDCRLARRPGTRPRHPLRRSRGWAGPRPARSGRRGR